MPVAQKHGTGWAKRHPRPGVCPPHRKRTCNSRGPPRYDDSETFTKTLSFALRFSQNSNRGRGSHGGTSPRPGTAYLCARESFKSFSPKFERLRVAPLVRSDGKLVQVIQCVMAIPPAEHKPARQELSSNDEVSRANSWLPTCQTGTRRLSVRSGQPAHCRCPLPFRHASSSLCCSGRAFPPASIPFLPC